LVEVKARMLAYPVRVSSDELISHAMTLRVEPSGASCGALIYGADLSRPHSHADIKFIRGACLKHQVIGICGQDLAITDLERFAAVLGPDGDDPFIASIAGHPRVVEVRREDTRPFDPVGQSLRAAYRDRRLSRPSASAMANYDRGSCDSLH
jgi:hypothetical protein